MSHILAKKKPDIRFEIFDALKESEHEQILVCSDPDNGLRGLIAIHNTVLGPSLGGVRMWSYQSEGEALRDVLRLSMGMTYKASLAGLNLGGGKAVLIGDSTRDKTEGLFRSFGRFVQGMGGQYITAQDVGMEVRDMDWIRMETTFVTGVSRPLGGSGDPSPFTAYGVYMGMKAAAEHAFGSDSLKNRSIAIQGAGKVSSYLARHLRDEEARVFIADIDAERAARVAGDTGARIADTRHIHRMEVDIFSPCALGGVLNEHTIPELKCAVVAGAANNQLEDERVHGAMLMERGMLYAPDYVINAGGLINVSSELQGYNQEYVLRKTGEIFDTLKRVLGYAETNKIPAHEASNRLAEERISKVARLKKN